MAQEKERQDRETHRRQIIKNKLRHRKESQLREQAEFEEAERLRMEELRRVFEKQRRKDTKRLVEMAKARLKRQSELRVEALGELARQKEEAEARLEAIRAKVRPVVPDDPFRVYSSTESWRHRLEQTTLPEEQEVVEARELLKFYVTIDNPITTFTDAQIQKDRRNRISTALFEAGLLGSN
uniref:CE152 n=1 Tax=Mesocestoides corti TaxID=53468 RepID=A0A5K3EW67_MESCO